MRVVIAVTLLCIAICPETVRAQGIFAPSTGPVNQSMGRAGVAAPMEAIGAINSNPALTTRSFTFAVARSSD
jgi:hypothetical protein